MDLSELTDSELIELRNKTIDDAQMYDILQSTKKVALNSAYGCMGGSFFRFYDIRHAEAITYTGQAVIKTVVNGLNKYLQKISNDEENDMVLAGDTDSVVGDSIIRVNNENKTISDFFDNVNGEYLKNDIINDNYVKQVDGVTTLSVSRDGDLQEKPIRYVMKHKVKKRLYEIKVNDKTVIVTEDHSVIAITNDFISQKIHIVKPSELSEKYLLLYLLDDELKCNYFKVTDLGIQEEWVYDIEVDDNHNFFANDICVHNSCFLHLESLVNKVFQDKEVDEETIINFLCKICDNQIQDVINKIFDSLFHRTNAFENHLHMKREKICSSGLWKAKKNYILNVWDNEGIRLSEPKIKISGIEAVKSSTPAVCRDKIKKAIECIMNSTEDELINFIHSFKKEFFSLPPEDISSPRGVSNMEKYTSAQSLYIKGTPIQARAAILYNYHLKENNLLQKYPLIKSGEKIKFCYLKLPNPIKEDVIGFVQRFPRDLNLEKYVDYELQFNKTFIEPLTKILDVIGWKTEKQTSIDSFFV